MERKSKSTMTKTIPTKKPRKVRKPLKVYAILSFGNFVILGIYRKKTDAETDKQYIKQATNIYELFVNDKPMWREIYQKEIKDLEQELKDHEYRINKQVVARRSALSCGEQPG